MNEGQRVTGHIANRDLGRVDFAGTVTNTYRSGRDTLVTVACDDGQERTARKENIQAVPTPKLTPKMQDALEKIRANGGRVGNGLRAYAALGVNAHSVRGLEGRGLLKHRYEDGISWLYIAA
jgi:hypothetical protein